MINRTLALVLSAALMLACGNSDDEPVEGQGGSGGATGGSAGESGGTGGGSTGGSGASGTGATAGAAGVAGASGSSGAGGSAVAGACAEVSFDLHASPQVYVTLEDMQTHTDPPSAYSFVMQKLHPAPTVYLGPGVQGINLGPDPGFDDVLEAPDSGYATDEPDPIIGRNYKSGGSGSTGFDMSGDVYVLVHPDGSYAKLSWTSAVAGKVTVSAYHSDSTDLVCTW